MTWHPLYMGLHKEHDGSAGKLTIGDAHMNVRRWVLDKETGTVSAEVQYDGDWSEFLARITQKVSG